MAVLPDPRSTRPIFSPSDGDTPHAVWRLDTTRGAAAGDPLTARLIQQLVRLYAGHGDCAVGFGVPPCNDTGTATPYRAITGAHDLADLDTLPGPVSLVIAVAVNPVVASTDTATDLLTACRLTATARQFTVAVITAADDEAGSGESRGDPAAFIGAAADTDLTYVLHIRAVTGDETGDVFQYSRPDSVPAGPAAQDERDVLIFAGGDPLTDASTTHDGGDAAIHCD